MIEPLRQPLSDQIVQTIAREVPAYTRPLSGVFGTAVRGGVEQALEQFAGMIRDPHASQEESHRLYVSLGRGELRSGRSIGALLAAYRLGAQVAWREFAAAGLRAGLSQATLNLLAESIFAFIEELSALSAEGYALEQSEHAGELDMRRGELIDLLLRDKPPVEALALVDAAGRARWNLPEQLTVLVWPGELGRRPASRLPRGSIAGELDGVFRALVPDPDGPGRRAQLQSGLAKINSAVGSVVAPVHAARSYAHALATLELGERRGAHGLTAASDHRVELICRGEPQLVAEIERTRLAALEHETPHSRDVLRATLLAWLRNDGNVTTAAAELHVHQQTVRYRLSRLRELLGAQLDDPDARLELEIALRAQH